MNDVLIAGIVFFVTYALIVSERVPRTLAALLGGLTMVWLGILEQHQAFEAIDFNVIFLLTGMMIIANVLRETGVFQWVAVHAVTLAQGSPFRIMAILSVITAISSALLDNVTVVILVGPITLFIASNLGVSPLPYLIAEVLASNIGGAATLIGDPPNILIGSAAKIDFATFLWHMGPISFLILIAFIGLARLLFYRDLKMPAGRATGLREVDTSMLITQPTLLRRALIVLGGTIVGFLLHGALHLEPATIALTGATILLIWTRQDLHHVLNEVEWPTLFFFIGLFMAVEGVVAVGLIDKVAEAAVRLVGNDVQIAAFIILWLSALASGIIDNIPYTATMIPFIQSLGRSMPIDPLWWALALGADLGGNATLVGASANVVIASLAERSGYPMKFRDFLRYGVPTTIMAMVISTLYIWLRYLRPL
ncbi:MAG TPA: ArsB/NhaD family transporter [Caldilineae bacterium]|nr:ArsB/NhaD family transporter [Caldilineae bacterium]